MNSNEPIVIDITGISAIGKSTWLNNKKNKSIVYNSRLSTTFFSYRLRLVLDHFRLVNYPSLNLSLNNVFWLFMTSMRLNESYKIKFSVFRNCLLKFLIQRDAIILSEKSYGSVIFIDEGISHIPFLLQNQKNGLDIIDEFFNRFSYILSDLNVICLYSDADTFIRLKKRGHKRLLKASDKQVYEFISMNKATLLIIKNNRGCFLTFNLEDLDS